MRCDRDWSLPRLCCLLLACCAGLAFDASLPRLAIDYGPRLIGLASSDILGCVRPYAAVKNCGDLVALSKDVVEIARRGGVKEIVVGLPVDSNGRVGYGVKNFNGQLCLSFSRVLCAVVRDALPHVKVSLADERYTTKEAKFRLKFGDGGKKKNAQASLDAMSAACLLERFIQDEGDGSIEAHACAFPVPRDLQYFDYETVREHIRETYYSEEDDFASSGTFAANKFNLERAKGLRLGAGPRRPRRILRLALARDGGSDSAGGGEGTDAVTRDITRDSELDKPFWDTFDKANAADVGNSGTSSISAAEEEEQGENREMKEYLRLKALRRRKGTLKKKTT